jgi:arachidonate 15-lipoxygenase
MTQSLFPSSQPSLPNNGNRPTRQTQLSNAQKRFEYNFNLIYPLPMLNKFNEFPTFTWLISVAKIALKLQGNTAEFTRRTNQNFGGLADIFQKNKRIINDNDETTQKPIDQKTDNVKPIVAEILTMLKSQPIGPPVNKLQDYNDIFTTIDLPEISNNFFKDFLDNDKEFAWMRVAGPNPLVIKKLTTIDLKFLVTEDHYQSVIPGDSLANALDQGRLFITDYAVLDKIETGITDGKNKYIYAPLVLFALPLGSRDLVPIAIQCGQDPAKDPIITPPPKDAPSESQIWAWRVAKTIVQIADANHHQLISHLGLTHLLLEVFAMATERQLAKDHPLGILLRAHFEGTFFINDKGQEILTGQNDPVDKLFAGTFQASQKLSADAILGLDFNRSLLGNTFESRGVDAKSLPDYPYRDDALKIWGAIHEWVSDYLSIYYENKDDDVQKDNELQSWLEELLDPSRGQLNGIGIKRIGENGKIRTLDYLINITTQIIFTASAQHAAVNFPQATLMSYAPAMPMAGYTLIDFKNKNVSEKDFFELLPPIKQAQEQLALTYLLGSVNYTQLGDYPTKSGENGQSVLGTSDPAVFNSLKKFKDNLEKIEKEIVDKNTKPDSRRKPYKFLIPSEIPQSTNI